MTPAGRRERQVETAVPGQKFRHSLHRIRPRQEVPVGVSLHRADLPLSVLTDQLTIATECIDVLVHAALFLHESFPGFSALLAERAAQGCTVRIALGDADRENVQQRGREEKFGHGIETRCRLAAMHYRPLTEVPGIEVRMHGTTR